MAENQEVGADGHDPPVQGSSRGRPDGHGRSALAQVESYGGETSILGGLLAKPPLTPPGAGGIVRPRVGSPARQVLEEGVHVLHLPDASFEAMTDCLFCKVVSGEADADEVLSTEHTYAFRDINPTAPVHVLVVPRRHIPDASEVSSEHAEVLAEMLTTAQEVARREGVDQRGYRLVMNVGEDALNSVGHLHMHVIGGRRMSWPPG